MIEDRVKKGVDCFRQSYNCCQAVLVAFEDEIPLSRDVLLNIGRGLGGGFARTRNLCGAVNAMGIVYGLIIKSDKKQAYADLQIPIEEFTQKYSSINCKDILKGVPITKGVVPEERTERYYATRPCERVVEDAIRIISKLVENRQV